MCMKAQGRETKSTPKKRLFACLSARGRQRHLATLCHRNAACHIPPEQRMKPAVDKVPFSITTDFDGTRQASYLALNSFPDSNTV